MTPGASHDAPEPPSEEYAAPWMQGYLVALEANGGQLVAAARTANVNYKTVFRHRQKDAAFETAEREVMQMAKHAAESEATRRAIEGVEEIYTTKDGTVHKTRKYSDTILLRLLEKHETGSWRQKQQIEHSGGVTFKTRAERKAALEQARAAKQKPVTAINGRS